MTWRLRKGVTWTKVYDGSVFFNSASGHFADLNQSATDLWERLVSADFATPTLTQYLTDERGLELEDAAAVTRDFLDDLVQSQILAPER